MSRFLVASLALAVLPAASSPEDSTLNILTGDVVWPGAAGVQAFDGHGGEVVTLRGFIPNAVLGPAIVRNAYRVIYVSRLATASRIEIKGINAEVSDACVRVHAEVVTVHDTHCTMTGGPQSGGVNMPFGLDIISARSVSVENSSFDGFQWEAPPNRYWNGDGVTIEKDVAAAEFRNVSANDNSDAGFDVRPFAIVSNASASGNCRNFRFWSGADVGRLTTGDTIKRGGISSCSGIWLNGTTSGARPKLHIRKLVVRMKRPGTIIEVETGPADIEVDACDIIAPRGTSMVHFDRGAGKTQLGPGCIQDVTSELRS
jgi:hypothetical protein